MSYGTEIETGTSRGRVHTHNGYYAGDFSRFPVQPMPWSQSTTR
jgi:hypothetical protein